LRQSVDDSAPYDAAKCEARAPSGSQQTATLPGGSEAERFLPINPQPAMAARNSVFGVKLHFKPKPGFSIQSEEEKQYVPLYG